MDVLRQLSRDGGEWMRFQSAQSDLGFRAHRRGEVSGNFTATGGFTLLLIAYVVLVLGTLVRGI
jgi:hypothetical protein